MKILKKDPLQIIPFRSYGTFNHLYAKGRALEDENIDLSRKGFFPLLWNTYKRFETDLITNTEVVLTLSDGRKIETKTDDQGYYLIEKNLKGLECLINDNSFLSYEIAFAENAFGSRKKPRKIQEENRFYGEIFIPSQDAKFGIVSDIDDTIIHTGLTSRFKWQVLKNTVFKRAEKRIPLDGAAEFYHKLVKGKSGSESNPLFYVSHGPWNLYRYLEVFLEVNDFPKGPILLRDFVNPIAKKINPKKYFIERPQKHTEILNILKTYPQLNFILIGDSGERDADIYLEIAEEHPERILAIYMRSVNHKKKMLRVKGLFKDYETVPVLMVENSKEAEEHAKDMGFI